MKIGVLSDTHDHLTMIEAALAIFRQRQVEMVLHPGDVVAPFAAKHLLKWTGPLKIIFGNNDGERKGLKVLLPQIQDGPLFIDAGGKKVLLPLVRVVHPQGPRGGGHHRDRAHPRGG